MRPFASSTPEYSAPQAHLVPCMALAGLKAESGLRAAEAEELQLRLAPMVEGSAGVPAFAVVAALAAGLGNDTVFLSRQASRAGLAPSLPGAQSVAVALPMLPHFSAVSVPIIAHSESVPSHRFSVPPPPPNEPRLAARQLQILGHT